MVPNDESVPLLEESRPNFGRFALRLVWLTQCHRSAAVAAEAPVWATRSPAAWSAGRRELPKDG